MEPSRAIATDLFGEGWVDSNGAINWQLRNPESRNCQAARPATKLRWMKRHLRFLLIFLISLALPLNGMAGIEAPTDPCPMQAAGMSQMTNMDMDCCQDHGKMAEHGKKACKTGQECKTGSMLQVSILKPPVSLAGPAVPAPYPEAAPDRTPADLWRPPCA